MKPISSEYRQFVQEQAPWFIQAVATAKERGEATTTTLQAFREHPFLLYASLWYADSQGVTVCVTAQDRRAKKP